MPTYTTSTAWSAIHSALVADNYSYNAYLLKTIYENQNYIYAKITGKDLGPGAAATSIVPHKHTGSDAQIGSYYGDGKAILGNVIFNQPSVNGSGVCESILQYVFATNGGPFYDALASNLSNGSFFVPDGVNRCECYMRVKWTGTATPSLTVGVTIGATRLAEDISSLTSGEWQWVKFNGASSVYTVTENAYNTMVVDFTNSKVQANSVYISAVVVYMETTTP